MASALVWLLKADAKYLLEEEQKAERFYPRKKSPAKVIFFSVI